MKSLKQYYKERLMETNAAVQAIIAGRESRAAATAAAFGAAEEEHGKKFAPGEIPTNPIVRKPAVQPTQQTSPTNNGYGVPLPGSGGMRSVNTTPSTTPATKTPATPAPSEPSSTSPTRPNIRKIRPWETA